VRWRPCPWLRPQVTSCARYQLAFVFVLSLLHCDIFAFFEFRPSLGLKSLPFASWFCAFSVSPSIRVSCIADRVIAAAASPRSSPGMFRQRFSSSSSDPKPPAAGSSGIHGAAAQPPSATTRRPMTSPAPPRPMPSDEELFQTKLFTQTQVDISDAETEGACSLFVWSLWL
jgi:hypothetical protein